MDERRERERERPRASTGDGLIKGGLAVAFAWREGGRRRPGEARWPASAGKRRSEGEAFDSSINPLHRNFKCGLVRTLDLVLEFLLIQRKLFFLRKRKL